jgi:Zn-dependent peptidase ImmA (M78 family)
LNKIRIRLKVTLNTKNQSINSNVSNLNNNDVLIYKINMKMKSWEQFCLWTS